MEQLMWIDLRVDPTDRLQLDALAAAVKREDFDRSGQPEPKSTICPYRGLLAFREQDTDFFFGRETYLKQLVDLVTRQNFIAVVGALGSGKSSLVSAGLIPQLRRKEQGPVWEIVRMVPDVDPLYSLAQALVPLIETDLSKLRLERELHSVANDLKQDQPTTPLWGLVNAVLREQPGTDRLLLFVDQWEELYTTCGNAKRCARFVAELLEASSRPNSPLVVVLTARVDFYGEMLRDRSLLDRITASRVDLASMTNEELRWTIEQPARRAGLTISKALVDLLLRDAGEEPGRLALLEFALKELWDRRAGGELTDEAYYAIGWLKGAIATRAEAIYKQQNHRRNRKADWRLGPACQLGVDTVILKTAFCLFFCWGSEREIGPKGQRFA